MMIMKKLVGIIIFIILFLFTGVCVVVWIDKNNIKDIKKDILKNTEIEDIIDVVKYDNYYIVKNGEYIYLLDYDYEEVFSIDVDLLHDNKNNYELIYRDNMLMYMDNYKSKDGIVFKYYDIYSYELIDEVMVGDN